MCAQAPVPVYLEIQLTFRALCRAELDDTQSLSVQIKVESINLLAHLM